MKKNFCSSVLLLFLILFGCTSYNEINYELQKPTEYAEIVFIRGYVFYGSLLKGSITLDDKYGLLISNNSYVIYHVNPGFHRLEGKKSNFESNTTSQHSWDTHYNTYTESYLVQKDVEEGLFENGTKRYFIITIEPPRCFNIDEISELTAKEYMKTMSEKPPIWTIKE